MLFQYQAYSVTTSHVREHHPPAGQYFQRADRMSGRQSQQIIELLCTPGLHFAPQLIGKTLWNELSYVTGFYYSYQNLNDRDETSFLDLSPLPVPLTVQHADTIDRDTSTMSAAWRRSTSSRPTP